MSGLWQTLTYPFRRGPRRPLAARRPERDEMGQQMEIPLGMEATDLKLIDRVARQNDALERTHVMKNRGTGMFFARQATQIDPMPEDETYAARFHRAYNKKDS